MWQVVARGETIHTQRRLLKLKLSWKVMAFHFSFKFLREAVCLNCCWGTGESWPPPAGCLSAPAQIKITHTEQRMTIGKLVVGRGRGRPSLLDKPNLLHEPNLLDKPTLLDKPKLTRQTQLTIQAKLTIRANRARQAQLARHAKLTTHAKLAKQAMYVRPTIHGKQAMPVIQAMYARPTKKVLIFKQLLKRVVLFDIAL